MPRPSFQFYPADWRSNAKLRRCSTAARGAWMDILCVLNDSDEYGACRWPLADLARAAGVRLKLAQELADKDVLKGANEGHPGFVWRPFHAGKHGNEITILENTNRGPLWYSSRMVRDEHIRLNRGKNTQFTAENQPPKATPSRRVGERQGDGSSSSSSSSEELVKEEVTRTPRARGRASVDKPEPVDFPEFYEKYPRREGRRTAAKAFASALTRAPAETILAGSARYALATTGTERRFVKLPATWLNGDHWNDEISTYGAQNGTRPSGSLGKSSGGTGSRLDTIAEAASLAMALGANREPASVGLSGLDVGPDRD